jgi:hypothetical protein
VLFSFVFDLLNERFEDSYAAALTLEEAATLVVGAEPKFGDISEDIDLHQIPENPV